MKKMLLILLSGLFAISGLGQSKKYALKITHLSGDLYLYVSYGTFNGVRYPANALYLNTPEGVILFDTPWGEEYFQPLLDSIQKRHHKKVVMCISTHFHDDRTGGLAYYNARGIKTFTTAMTDSLSVLHHNHRANHIMPEDTLFHYGGHTFRIYYPGAGHAPDNLVVWFPKEKVLYGGCLIKSMDAENLGNLDDANVQAWAQSLKNIRKKFRHPSIVIVGHGRWQDRHSIAHTLALIKTYEKHHP